MANLIIPKLIANEIERMSIVARGPVPITDRWKDWPVTTFGMLWWVTWVAGAVVWPLGAGMEGSAEFVSESIVGTALIAQAVSLLCLAISAALGASYVEMLARRLKHGPNISQLSPADLTPGQQFQREVSHRMNQVPT